MSTPWHRWMTHKPEYRHLVIARMRLSEARAEVGKPLTAAAYRDAIALLVEAGDMDPSEDYLAASLEDPSR